MDESWWGLDNTMGAAEAVWSVAILIFLGRLRPPKDYVKKKFERSGKEIDSNRRKRGALRALPSFVVHTVEQGGLLVGGYFVLVIKDLGLVKQLVVKAEHLLVFGVSWENGRSHCE